MKNLSFLFSALVVSLAGVAQKVTLNPSVSPSLFRYNDPITVTYDVTGTSLANLSNAYIWVWIPGKNTNAKYNINPASNDAVKTNNAKFVKSTSDGKTLFTLTFKPSDFFEGSISSETKIGMLLKGNDWSNGQTTDYLADFWDGNFQVKLTLPQQQPLFVSTSQTIDITAETPVAATFNLYINDVLADTQNDVTVFQYSHTVTETSGHGTVKIIAEANSNSNEISFQYIISASSPQQSRPTGIIPGINYYPDDHTKVTLCLWAPGKSSVYVFGDFSEWRVLPGYIMKRDGEYFWIELTGLTAGEEYGYQYLVDETLRMADPYADKILDPDDQYIPASLYPGLKLFPSKALQIDWYFNRVAVFQTNQTPYQWQVENFIKPAKEKLVIYELLIRDFFGSDKRSYQSLIDTISYFKRLGVNAIELMPIMEFNGNDSWGYNPAFMFAPDKYYGPKNKLKEFIDKCHQNGIAVILDIAMNHQDLPNPYVMLDFNFDTYTPTAENKWFNTTAKHPYNVFHDMNHESSYTKTYVDTVNYHWLKEYRIDGYRFDLSKGFTQNERCSGSASNENCFGQRDDSRISLLKKMADKIWEHSPDAYIILEHFAANTEEKELAEYRANEGKGMMLWGNLNHAYNQLTMGYSEGSDISGVYYKSRNWDVPHLISYMETHDEERLMYKNLQYGNEAESYSVKDASRSLQRIKAASVCFFTIPGPKMLWQFGELGYDKSINTCSDGSISDNCRVAAKPVGWQYKDEPLRKSLFELTADLLRLRKTFDVFTKGDATITSGTSLVKQISIKNSPYTATPPDPSQMNVQIVANFDVKDNSIAVTFPHAGLWYDYYTQGSPLNVTSPSFTINVPAGGYRMFTDVLLAEYPVTSVESKEENVFTVFPNPTHGKFVIPLNSIDSNSIRLLDVQGKMQSFVMEENTIDISHLPSGLYVLKGYHNDGSALVQKVVKR